MFRKAVLNGLFVLVIGVGCANSQQAELDRFTWENRLLLIFSNASDDPAYLSQMKQFEGMEDELLDRKLLLINIQKKSHRFINLEDANRDPNISFSSLFNKHMKSGENFKLLLIGLDGTVKFESREVITSSQLFGRIDAMPMRRSELRN